MNPILVIAFMCSAILLMLHHGKNNRKRLSHAFELGRQYGHFHGWMAHAEGIPLDAMPPRAEELHTEGFVFSCGRYADTDEWVQSGTVGNISWEEWQTMKLMEINRKYSQPSSNLG